MLNFGEVVYTTTTTSTSGGGAAAVIMLLVYLLIGIVAIVAMWKLFEKAGQPGWAAIIPIYNTYTLIKVAGRPGWWLLLLFVPFVNFVVLIVLSLDIAKNFGKSTAFAIFGLIIFSIIGYLILGFGDAEYKNVTEGSNSGPVPAAA